MSHWSDDFLSIFRTAVLAFILGALLYGAGMALSGWLSVVFGAERGIASVYTHRSGHRTASGEPMRDNALTAAHRAPLPLGTRLLVRHGRRTVVVRINDRGPFRRGRVIDLTPAAARALGISGLGFVSLERVR